MISPVTSGRKRAAFALACALMVTMNGSSAAQLGSIFPDRAANPSERAVAPADQARQTMNDYAVSLVHARLVGVQRALALSSDAEIGEALAKLADKECLAQGELRMSRALLRGAIYRALYLHDFGRIPPPAPEPTSPPSGDSMFDRFGSCVYAADAHDTREFIASLPATTREAAALKALGPIFGRCIPERNQIRFSKAVLQGVLAEAAYRHAKASTLVNK